MIKKITLEEFCDALYVRPGLVIGAKATCLPGEVVDLRNIVATNSMFSELEGEESLEDLFEIAKNSGDSSVAQVFDIARQHFSSTVGPNTTNSLANVNWSACVSISQDLRLSLIHI